MELLGHAKLSVLEDYSEIPQHKNACKNVQQTTISRLIKEIQTLIVQIHVVTGNILGFKFVLKSAPMIILSKWLVLTINVWLHALMLLLISVLGNV